MWLGPYSHRSFHLREAILEQTHATPSASFMQFFVACTHANFIKAGSPTGIAIIRLIFTVFGRGKEAKPA